MDFLASVDPVKLAKEHEAIVDALDRGDGKKAGALIKRLGALRTMRFLLSRAPI